MNSALPQGTHLCNGTNKYRVRRILGSPGAAGITYLASDARKELFAVKELFPEGRVYRDVISQHVYAPTEALRAQFLDDLLSFEREAQCLAQLGAMKRPNPSIVKVVSFFRANGTAYMVMKYEHGRSLEDHFKDQIVPLSERELLGILNPLLSALDCIHKAELLHRDITPSNIYITSDGWPILLDFGAVRELVMSKTHSLSVIHTLGYAPHEQYAQRGNVGPWTDIYSLGAVLHCAITGSPPPDAISRRLNDCYIPLARRFAGGQYSHNFLSAVDRALATDPHARPASAEEWKALFRVSATPRGVPWIPLMLAAAAVAALAAIILWKTAA